MAEAIRGELIVPEDDAVRFGGGHAVSVASKGSGSRAKGSLSLEKGWGQPRAKAKPPAMALSKAKGSGSTAKVKAPTWADVLGEEKLLESVWAWMSQLSLLIEIIDRPPERRARMLAARPHLERCIQVSLEMYYQLKELAPDVRMSLSRLSLTVRSERSEQFSLFLKDLLPPELKATEETNNLSSGLELLLADPEAAEQFKTLLKQQRFLLYREYLRRVSGKRDPDFPVMSEADRAAEADRLRQEAFQEASRFEEGDPERRRLEATARILDFDPKQGGIYFNSYRFQDLSTFDLGEESPIGPMRFTRKVFKDNKAKVCTAVNILSVRVACSDVAFPIQVYGTVIVRDSTDFKRIYLFRRDSDHCQFINSKDEPLILTGPKRGLAILDGNYVETDLKIRDNQGQDRELSKGLLIIKGIVGRSLEKCQVETLALSTRLSTVKMVYAVVVSAVEATVAIEVVEGEFCGTVTAHTTNIKERLVLYDSQLAGHRPAGVGRGPVEMMRPVVSVCVKDELIIVAKGLDGKLAIFTLGPKVSGGQRGEFTLGTAKMRLQVDWSIMDPTCRSLILDP